ncbi:MAG: galactose-1-epimerase [Spirochaetae bacterium HGW-Spirochaetae-9]|nr:MAG: galactose-1-epimerase [Spirochaetae bacterium HGW-Spirochaetae-9]
MTVIKKQFGTLSTGEDVSLFLMEAGEYKAGWSDYGASWVSFIMPDTHGKRDDLLLGFSSFSPYAQVHPYFGATVGRYANRIADAKFSIGSREYPLFANNGPNHLHGGKRGFSRRLWDSDIESIAGNPALRFTLRSPDGDEGYPGNLIASVIVTLSAEGKVRIAYDAQSDSLTPVNLTNHAYFNLRGEGSGTILDHELSLTCSRYLPVDSTMIPLAGDPRDVGGTVFDFRRGKRMGADLDTSLVGYDHCFMVDGTGSEGTLGREPFATVAERGSGRRLEVHTTLPAVQFYTGNSLNGIIGKHGSVYGKHAGFCLETQYCPNSPNRPDFPSCWIQPGERWIHTTEYHFSVL